MLEDIQHLLEGMEAVLRRSTGAKHRREQKQNKTTNRDVQDDYTDSEEEEQGYLRARAGDEL